jgi:hypothetical protein
MALRRHAAGDGGLSHRKKAADTFALYPEF